MRHSITGNELSATLNTLNALASAASRQAAKGEPPMGSAMRISESWVERISKERWTVQKGLAFVSAVVGVGVILYGTKKFLAYDKSDDRKR